MTTAAERLDATFRWLKESSEVLPFIDTERKLYIAIGRALGRQPDECGLPVSRKLAARAIRHYARTGEFLLIEISHDVKDKPTKKKWVARERLRGCFEIGDVGDSRPGLLQTAMENRRPTRITLMFEQQGGACHYCHEPMLLNKEFARDPRFATLDHVHPKCQGGIRSADNSVAACARCNSEKAHMAYHLFKAIKGAAA